MKYIGPLIVVEDIKRSRRFYESILGQTIKFDFGEDIQFNGDFSIHLKKHYAKIVGCGEDAIIRRPNNFELYFEIDDLDNISKKLKENEIEFLHEIVEQPWGQRVMRIYDPDYHIIEIGESLETVVLRYNALGLSIEKICAKTSLPEDYVKKILGK